MGIGFCARGCWVKCFGYCLLCYGYRCAVLGIGSSTRVLWVMCYVYWVF